MPKLRCRCGNVIDLSPIPAPDGYHLISETLLDDLVSKAATRDELHVAIIDQSFIVYLCPVCQRLIVEWDREQKHPPTLYRRE